MAIYNHMIWVATALIVGPTYSNIDPSTKVTFIWAGFGLGLLIFVWVSVFAWIKPKHLLYGADTHFAEWKYSHEESGKGSTVPTVQTTTQQI